MCCRRPGQPRRTPLIVTLGQFAYNKYQERKQQQRALTANSGQYPENIKLQRRSSPPPHVLERDANREILEKTGLQPPSYEDAVSGSDDDLSDADSLSELEGREAELVKGWRESEERPVLTKCQQRRAERMARKAEKAVARAERAERGL